MSIYKGVFVGFVYGCDLLLFDIDVCDFLMFDEI